MIVPVAILLVIGAIASAGAMSWVVFGLIMWGVLWLLFGGRRRKMRDRHRHGRRWADPMQEAPMPPPPSAPPPLPLAPTPEPIVSLNLDGLPADVATQAKRIERKAAVLGRHPDRFPIGSKDLYVVQQTRSDYLPATVKAYREVPPWSVSTPTADGRTPLQMLQNQLELLETKIDEIAESVRKQRVDNLLANERFLEDNFGKPDAEELTLPR